MATWSEITESLLITLILWPLIISVPLVLTYNNLYQSIFPSSWYDTEAVDYWTKSYWPSPLGLSLGILAVIVGQVITLVYFVNWKRGKLTELHPIQKEGPPNYDMWEAMQVHLCQPEGFVMLGGYLSLTWMFGLMPASYYSFSGGISVKHVLLQLLVQDTIQATVHWLEHVASPAFYGLSHKPHHRFINPKLFDAFNGSVWDTLFMILCPLALTARIVPANAWSYMVFGSLYANWLTLIHSEYKQPWDSVFRFLGLGTSADHHVHHKLFNYNYGHLFMYWDYACGTYINPKDVKHFNKDV